MSKHQKPRKMSYLGRFNTWTLTRYHCWLWISFRLHIAIHDLKYSLQGIQSFIETVPLVVVEFFFAFMKPCQFLNNPCFPQIQKLYVWAKLTFTKMSPIYICSFYRPHNTDTIPLTQLQTTLHGLKLNHSSPNIIIAGDFNLPRILWSHTGAGFNNIFTCMWKRTK